MKKIVFPVFITPCVVLRNETVFFKIKNNVSIKVPQSLMHQLVNLCDGSVSLQDIINSLKKSWDKKTLISFLNRLFELELLSDASLMSEQMWKFVKNSNQTIPIIDKNILTFAERSRQRHRIYPNKGIHRYRVKGSNFLKLLSLRKSVRSFSNDPVELQKIIDILWSSYGEISSKSTDNTGPGIRRTVPSAGALYPLIIHLVLLRRSNSFSPGVYRVILGSVNTVALYKISSNIDELSRSFVDPSILENAHGVIVISGSFRIMSRKYGNRGMLYTILEAGYAAQNIHISSLSVGVSTVEVGGFIDELLSSAVGLSTNYSPLTTIVFGYKGDVSKETGVYKIDVRWTPPIADSYRVSFAIASARINKRMNEDWSCGRAVSTSLAKEKAIVEAKEWGACGCVPKDIISARISDLISVIDPRSIISFDQHQYHLKNFPFKPFNNSALYTWTHGREYITNLDKFVLADLVYFPYYPKTPLFAYSNSSGVASRYNLLDAVKTSTLELIERDSFMFFYLTGVSPTAISFRSLTRSIQKRIKELERNGFRVSVLDYSLDLAPVIFVFAQNKELSYTTCSACSSFDIEHAIDHALMEVESSVIARFQNGPSKLIKPESVVMPADHGSIYEQKQYFQKADFLASAHNFTQFKHVGRNVAKSWSSLLNKLCESNLSLITIQLSPLDEFPEFGDLYTVRSIIPGLIPMTFGYRQEPGGIMRTYELAKRLFGKSISYKDLSKFPHPFA